LAVVLLLLLLLTLQQQLLSKLGGHPLFFQRRHTCILHICLVHVLCFLINNVRRPRIVIIFFVHSTVVNFATRAAPPKNNTESKRCQENQRNFNCVVNASVISHTRMHNIEDTHRDYLSAREKKAGTKK